MDTNTNDKTVESPGEWGIVMIYGCQPPQENHRESEVYGPYKPASASVLQAAAGLYSHTTQGLPSCLVLLTNYPSTHSLYKYGATVAPCLMCVGGPLLHKFTHCTDFYRDYKHMPSLYRTTRATHRGLYIERCCYRQGDQEWCNESRFLTQNGKNRDGK